MRKIVAMLLLVFGFLTRLRPVPAATVIAGIGPGALAGTVGTLDSAIAGSPLGITEVRRLRPSRR